MSRQIVICLLLLSLVWIRSGSAQLPNKSFPNEIYYAAFSLMHEGEYRDAGSAFRRAARGGVASAQGRWIDSICYFTMMGECFYHLGQYSNALEQYEAALRLSLVHEGWTSRIKWPPTIVPSQLTMARPPNWGTSTRRRQIARVPDKMQMLQGDVERYYVMVDVQEIMRCIGLSMRRRREILGPLGRHNRLNSQLSSSLARMPLPANHWSRIWQKALVGIAFAAEGKINDAVAPLTLAQKSGALDHKLTSMVLLELGHIAFAQNQLENATSLFYEASFPAAQLELFDDVAEGLTWAAASRLALGKQDVYPPLIAAATWAHRESEPTEFAVLSMAAENAVAIGQIKSAEQLVVQANRVMGRSDLRVNPRAAQLEFVLAYAALKSGDAVRARALLDKAMQAKRKTSKRMFQLAMADGLIARKTVSPRVAADLYEELLRIPTARDWKTDPLESLTFLNSPQEEVLVRWFELSLERRELEKSLRISERVRQNRFHRSLPLGGRLLSIRWLLNAPIERLDDAFLQQRADLLNKYPAYRQLAMRAGQIKTELRQLDAKAAADDQADIKSDRKKRLTELATVSQAREGLLWNIAFSREHVPLMAPQIASLEEIQAALRPKERAIVFFQTSSSLYGMLVRKEEYSVQRLGSARGWRSQISNLLRSMNLIDANRTATFETETLEQWKKKAEELVAVFDKAFKGGLLGDDELLTIVPDGPLWYLPFQALPDRDGKVLAATTKIRYLPLLSMMTAKATPAAQDAVPVLVRGAFFPSEESELELLSLEDYRDALPNLRMIRKLDSPAIWSIPQWDRVIVLADAPLRKEGLRQWSPLAIDRGTPGSKLMDWMKLPFGSPREIIIPGFHTPAETALRSSGDGSELFLLTCALYASGTQTALVSRWRAAAFPSSDLVREFAQELSNLSAQESWQRAIQVIWESDVDTSAEPKLKIGENAVGLKGDHPYFWAGYLLFDLDK